MTAFDLFTKLKYSLQNIGKHDLHKHDSNLWYAYSGIPNSYLIMNIEEQTVKFAWGLSPGLAIANALGLISESDAIGIEPFRKDDKDV